MRKTAAGKNQGPKNDIASGASPQSEYDEAQKDEILVLQSMFAEDFEEVKGKAAWSKQTEKSFKLKLRAPSSADISVVLSGTLTATYPKTVPLLRVEDAQSVRPGYLDNIRQVVANKPKELVGNVMIWDLAVEIQDLLEESFSAQARDKELPSLEEERVMQEAQANRIAQHQKEQTEKLEQEAKAEEQREYQRKLEEEIKRREDAKHKDAEATFDVVSKPNSSDQLILDREIQYRDDQGVECTFQALWLIAKIRAGPVSEVYTVRPISRENSSVILALKRIEIPSYKDKKPIFDVEKDLEKLKAIRHSNAVNVLDFKIDSEQDGWQFDIITDFANQGSLANLLDICNALPIQKVKSFSIGTLEALDFYHKNGIVHGDVHLSNVLLSRSSNGNTTVKLADAGFQNSLFNLKRASSKRTNPVTSIPIGWIPSELTATGQSEKTRKTDIWEFGIVLMKMVMGLDATETYPTPGAFINDGRLSEPFSDLVGDIFKSDPRKRPSAFDIIPHEFLRTNVPALTQELFQGDLQASFSNGLPPITTVNSRIESNVGGTASRYSNEWDEVGTIGKGGYGEVVKARNKIDGRIYAIKKITQKSQSELSQVLSEVHLLATLNHPYVVRYYTAWPEFETPATPESSEDMSSSVGGGFFSNGNGKSFDYGASTGGLDFISSSGFPKIEFGDDDSEDEDEEDSEESSEDEAPSPDKKQPYRNGHPQFELQRLRSASKVAPKSTLYIQMEFCERRTLRDMIKKNIYENMENVWQLFRQILEGLVHIHTHGIIHRDLKPENIFIDVANNPRIGDFGLATSGQYYLSERHDSSHISGGDLTRSIGTLLYVAPEIRSNAGGSYTEKVDMYSLGIIFFEMCYPLKTAMERGQILRKIREKDHALPPEFQSPDRALQGEIIESLISHRPSQRPTSAELLRSGKIPVQIQDETIRLALQGLTDDTSPYYHKMMSALFSQGSNRQIRDHMWDMGNESQLQPDAAEYTLLQGCVKDMLASCFRRHGAVETTRQSLFPRSDYYSSASVVQLLDASGTLLQLPYDLTLPHARAIARQGDVVEKTFTFGTVFRNAKSGGAPQSNREADFDLVSFDTKDLALKEAEVIKVLDEILDAFPCFRSTPMSFHISHSDLLEMIMEFCRIPVQQRPAVKEILGKLNIQYWTWQRIRVELRAPSLGISSTSLDALTRFDFRDTPEKCLKKLQEIFVGTPLLAKIHEIFTHVSGLVEYCKRWNVHRPIYFSPLSSFNDKFYQGGMMFQCLFDTKKRDVLAAGGRYDRLISDLRPRAQAPNFQTNFHAVGINVAWDRIVSSMMRYQKHAGNAFLKKSEEPDLQGPWAERRCDVLVASFDSETLRSSGMSIVAELWSNDISAELATDSKSPEQLVGQHREDKHGWIVIVKHEELAHAKPDLKVKSMDKKEDYDMRRSELIAFLRTEIRERSERTGTGEKIKLPRQASHSGETSAVEKKNDVKVLIANHKSQKVNKWRYIETAQTKAQELVKSFAGGPIASIETRDEVLDMIRETRLSDAESWRKVKQSVSLSERQYVQEVQDLLMSFKMQYGETSRNCFVYNFRTGTCIYYDMKL